MKVSSKRGQTMKSRVVISNENNNNNVPERKSKGPKFAKKGQAQNTSFYTRKRNALTLIVLVCGVGGYFLKEYLAPEKMYKMSEIIRLHLRVANQIIDHELQLRSFLGEDPTIEIVKNGLRPIQERVSSLRVQCSQYEKMGHIPGGPTSFIETSLKEIDSIITNQLLKLSNEALASIADKAKSLHLLSKSTKALVSENFKTTDPEVIKWMVLDDFVIIPLDEEKEEIERLANSSFTTIENAMDKMSHLANMYDELAGVAEQTAIEFGYASLMEFAKTDWTDEEYDSIYPKLEDILTKSEAIVEEKKKYMKHYKVFWVLKAKIVSNVTSLLDLLRTYERDKRAPFLDLQTMIMKDIGNLKTRIINLQYKYAKKSLEF